MLSLEISKKDNTDKFAQRFFTEIRQKNSENALGLFTSLSAEEHHRKLHQIKVAFEAIMLFNQSRAPNITTTKIAIDALSERLAQKIITRLRDKPHLPSKKLINLAVTEKPLLLNMVLHTAETEPEILKEATQETTPLGQVFHTHQNVGFGWDQQNPVKY